MELYWNALVILKKNCHGPEPIEQAFLFFIQSFRAFFFNPLQPYFKGDHGEK